MFCQSGACSTKPRRSLGFISTEHLRALRSCLRRLQTYSNAGHSVLRGKLNCPHMTAWGSFISRLNGPQSRNDSWGGFAQRKLFVRAFCQFRSVPHLNDGRDSGGYPVSWAAFFVMALTLSFSLLTAVFLTVEPPTWS